MKEVLVKVRSKLFTAWITLLDDMCITTSPLLEWCKGREAGELRETFRVFGWTATVVPELPVEARVILTRTGLLEASPEERAQLEALFGVDMIRSIVGGNAAAFEGEWKIGPPKKS